MLMRRGKNRLIVDSQFSLALAHITSGAEMKLGCRHRFLKLRRLDHPSKKRIGIEQNRIIKEDVVNPHDFFVAQNNIGSVRVALMHRQPQSEMRVMIKISTGRNNPIDEA